MAEYIFKEAERSSYLTANTNEIITTLEKKERIVRCRDCEWFSRSGACVLMPSQTMNVISPSPNGFCAWGEPKEGD